MTVFGGIAMTFFPMSCTLVLDFFFFKWVSLHHPEQVTTLERMSGFCSSWPD